MNEKPKIPRRAALAVANELIALLEPVCERIVIAGSLRRGKESVGDVELLFIPAYETRQADMFASASYDMANERLGELLMNGTLSKRPSKVGVFTWSLKNKLAIHGATETPVDLFATTAENWWVSLVVRTGSKETNLRLTTGARHRNRTLNAYGCGVTDLLTGEVTPALSEQDVFELCGVPYLEPHER